MYIKISKFAGTDDERIVKVPDDVNLADVEAEELAGMIENLFVAVEKIEEGEIDKDDVEEW